MAMTEEEGACAEEQEMEVEALQSIMESRFMSGIESPSPPSSSSSSSPGEWYGVEVYPFEEEEDEAALPVAVKLLLLFRFTPLYPSSTGPELRLRAESGISDADAGAVQASMEAAVPELLGMAMIFEMVERIKEEVRALVRAKAAPGAAAANPGADAAAPPDADAAAESSFAESMRAADAAAARMRELRRVGTLVTAAVFAEWKSAYAAEVLRETEDARRALSAALAQRAANTNDVTLSGLTGKEVRASERARVSERVSERSGLSLVSMWEPSPLRLRLSLWPCE